MGIKEAILSFYLMYTGYLILVCGSTNLSIIYIIPALIVLWMIYFAFFIGISEKKRKIIYNKVDKSENIKRTQEVNETAFLTKIFEKKSISMLAVGIICIIISIICAHYYTGLWPSEVIRNLLLANSNYYSYQSYFQEANIGAFSIAKIPFVLLLALNNIIFVYSFIYLLCNGKKIHIKYIIYLALIGIAHLYVGVARGTNFEIYKLFIILSYCYIMRKRSLKKNINYALIGIMGIILVIIYINVLAARNVEPDYNIATYIHYDKDALFSQIFPVFSQYYLFLFSYLGFGIYYIATMINDIWFNSWQGFLGAIFPLFNKLTSIDSIEITNQIVDIGVKWVPDGASIMYITGLPMLLVICFFLGKFVAYNQKGQKTTFFYFLWGYLVFVLFCSIPVGHFLSFSSEILMIVYSLILYLVKKYRIQIKWK